MKRVTRLLAAGAVTITAVTVPSLLHSVASASSVGTLSFSPTNGDSDTNISATTSGPCPDTSTKLTVNVTGGDPGTAGSQVTNQPIVGVTNISAFSKTGNGGIVIPLTLTMRDFAQGQGFTPIKGSYSYTVSCYPSSGPSLGEFTAPLVWTPGAGAFDATYVATQATTTSLAVAPTSPQAQGTPVTLTATVSPSNAAGSVQFKDGSANLGSPVAVSAGTASTLVSTLGTGSHSLTAVFTPTSALDFTTSTSSAVPFAVTYQAPAQRPTVYGAVSLGGKPACIASFANATSVAYQWLDGANPISGATASSYAIPESLFGHLLACRVTASNPDNAPLVTTSASTKVAAGPALRASVLPSIAGTPRLGQRLTTRPGTWSPAATSYLYQWYRDGRAIAGQTGVAHVVSTADVGHLLTVRVQARRTNWATGSAISKAVRATR